MSRAYLRYAPVDDQRPDPLAPTVISRAAMARIDEIMEWLKPRIPTLTREEVLFALEACIRSGAADGFRAGVGLKENFGWPVNTDLVLLLRDCCDALAYALRVETRMWAVRAGVRFPASENERIEWSDERGKGIAGVVISVDPSYAAAIVQPMTNDTKAGQPRRVYAERVFANVTRGEYAFSASGKA